MYLAIKEIKHSKAKYLSIILVIALISWLIFLSSSLTEGLSNGNRQEVDRWNAQSIFLNEASNNTISASFIEYKETEDENLARVSTKFTTIRSDSTESENIVLLGYDTGSFIEPRIIEGSINKKDDEIVTYCTAGIRSAHMQIVLDMLGYKDAKNYDQSFNAWAGNEDLEVVK